MTDLRELSLMDLVVAMHPSFGRPGHLWEWCRIIEGSLAGNVRAMISVPWQHYKSWTTMAGVVWLMLRNPRLHIVLMTHSHEKAKAMGKELRELCKLAGLRMRTGFNEIAQWQTEEGGGCVIISSQQSALGYPVDILLVDDPIDETEYMMQDVRDRVDRAIADYTDRAASHLNVVLIVASRWHPDDPIGRRLKRTAVKWSYTQHAGLTVICPCGWESYYAPKKICPKCDRLIPDNAELKAFAPEVLDVQKHLALRAETFERDPSGRFWYAQMQNEPLPDALGFFAGYTPFSVIPSLAHSQIMIGVDAAFTAGKKSDYFAAVCCVALGDTVGVFRVIRHQRGLVEGINTLQALKQEFPHARFVSYVSGAEKGIYDALFQVGGLEVEQMPARWHKGVRAQKATKAWQEKKILVATGQLWTPAYLAEMQHFDGSETGVDDQVDATVSAFDAIQASRPVQGMGNKWTFGRVMG